MSRRKALTDASVAALKPRATRYTVADPLLPGHYVRVTPTGHKSFCAVTTDPNGKLIWTTIETASLFSIDESRAKARETLKAVRAGEGTGPEAFLSVASAWIKRHVAKKGLLSRAEIERILAKYIMPKWAGRDFTSIKRSDVAALLDHVEDKHGARQADYCLAIISSIANWYATRHDNYSSPLVRGMKRAAGAERKRKRTFDDDELRALWSALPDGDTFGDLIKLLLLTGQRREKVAGMKWSEVSIDGVWRIPAEQREKGTGGELVLSATALQIIKARPHFNSNPFVLAGRGSAHFCGYSKCKIALNQRLKAAGLDLPGWTCTISVARHAR
jgi:integrase